MKLAPTVTKILYSPGFLALTFDLLTRNLIGTSMNPNTSVAKTGRNSLHWFLRYGVHKVFGTHRLTDGHTRKQNASDTEGFCWQRHKICKAHNVSAQAESEVHCKAKLPRSRPLKQRQGHRRKAKVTTKPADRVKAEVYRPM